MPKIFTSVEERRAYWRNWYQNNKHRPEYKAADYATKKRLRQERRDWVLSIKKDLSCKECGNPDFRVLDFHHRDPGTKDMEVSSLMWSSTKKKILEEIAKCDVLCANCHRIHHWEERNEENKE